jgi:tRNA(Ile)-lysidine synthase TilS/MesJ
MPRELNLSAARLAERSIQKRYRKELWNPFVGAVKRYRLIQEGDSVAACVSGGKDSFLTAKLLQMLRRSSDTPFELRFLCMDPGYSAENRRKILDNAEILEIPLEIFDAGIFDYAAKQGGAPCYLCARMRRGHLYKEARARGCNKIALGHHFNDVIETTLMGMLYGAQLQAMPPKLKSRNFPGLQLIRPLYCVREEDIVSWAGRCGLTFLRCACPLAERGGTGGKRQEVKELIARLKRTHQDVEKCIFQSIHNVKLDTMAGYTRRGAAYSFLDEYDA